MAKRSTHRGRRFPLWRIVLCLVLGAVINVLVAWALAIWTPLRDTDPSANQPDYWPGLTEGVPFPDGVPSGWEDISETAMLLEGWGCSINVYSTTGTHRADTAIQVRAGWPFRSMRTLRLNEEIWSPAGVAPQANPDIRISSGPINGFDMDVLPDSVLEFITLPGDQDPEGRIVPLVPIRSGFFLNVLIYSVLAWWLLPKVVSTARAPHRWLVRDRRSRRGLCQACAYDRSDLPEETPCPECGTPA